MQLTGALVEDGDASSEDEQEVRRYPTRTRDVPSRYGQDAVGATASAATVKREGQDARDGARAAATAKDSQ